MATSKRQQKRQLRRNGCRRRKPGQRTITEAKRPRRCSATPPGAEGRGDTDTSHFIWSEEVARGEPDIEVYFNLRKTATQHMFICDKEQTSREGEESGHQGSRLHQSLPFRKAVAMPVQQWLTRNRRKPSDKGVKAALGSLHGG